jgi:diacylglycerol kinase family enzyme
VGAVNGRVFLVNASLGLYPELLEDREVYKRRFGRSRLVAFGAGLVTLLREHRRLRLRLELDGRATVHTTPTLFVGNNRLQLEQIGVPQADAVDRGQLAAILLRPIGVLAMLRLLVRGAMSQLGEADDVLTFGFERMTVTPRWRYGRRRIKVATDGEVVWMRAPLDFSVRVGALTLLVPATPPGDERA